MSANMRGLEPSHYKSYSFTTTADGSVKALTSPTIRRHSKNDIGSVYHIWNNKTGKSYVGKAVNYLRRIYAHVFSANHPESSGGRRLLAAALRSNPKDFKFKILKSGLSSRELSLWEKHFIKKLKPSLNMNGGGGGGGGAVPAEECSKEPVVEKFSTPQKVYPVTRRNGRIEIELTPSAGLIENAVYVFKKIIGKGKDKGKVKRLIGRTGMKLKKRVSAYKYVINKNSTDSKVSSFINSIRKNPRKFTFGVLAISNTPDNLDELEREYIGVKKSQENGYNCNRGGGGGTVCS